MLIQAFPSEAFEILIMTLWTNGARKEEGRLPHEVYWPQVKNALNNFYQEILDHPIQSATWHEHRRAAPTDKIVPDICIALDDNRSILASRLG